MPKNINQIKKPGQILILQQILKLKNIKLLPKNLNLCFSTYCYNFTQTAKFKPNKTLFDST